jgi:hypothetical protein
MRPKLDAFDYPDHGGVGLAQFNLPGQKNHSHQLRHLAVHVSLIIIDNYSDHKLGVSNELSLVGPQHIFHQLVNLHARCSSL